MYCFMFMDMDGKVTFGRMSKTRNLSNLFTSKPTKESESLPKLQPMFQIQGRKDK